MWKFMRNYDLLLTPTLACPPFPVHTQGPEKIEGRIVDPFPMACFHFPDEYDGSTSRLRSSRLD